MSQLPLAQIIAMDLQERVPSEIIFDVNEDGDRIRIYQNYQGGSYGEIRCDAEEGSLCVIPPGLGGHVDLVDPQSIERLDTLIRTLGVPLAAALGGPCWTDSLPYFEREAELINSIEEVG